VVVDRLVVGTGALSTLAVALPPVWLVSVLKSDDVPGEESNLWLLTPVALLAGFAIGGFVAARRRRDTPLLHAATAAAAAFAVVAVFALVRRIVGSDDVTVSYVVRLLLLAQICVSTALLGGWVAARRAARPR
jgi:predicted permease